MADETEILQKPKRAVADESYFISHNLSGRFWIALCAINWVGIATLLIMSGFVKLDSNAAIAVYTAFSTGTLGIITLYMGQNSKPKAQETPVK